MHARWKLPPASRPKVSGKSWGPEILRGREKEKKARRRSIFFKGKSFAYDSKKLYRFHASIMVIWKICDLRGH